MKITARPPRRRRKTARLASAAAWGLIATAVGPGLPEAWGQVSYTITDLGSLGKGATASGINDSGQVVGTSGNGEFVDNHAFLWSGGSMSDLGTLGGPQSVALGINNSGQIVGTSRIDAITPAPYHAFIWSGGSMSDLGGGDDSGAMGINDSGQVVGIANGHAVLWSGGSMTTLAGISLARAINNSGQVVGSSANGARAVLWSGGSVTDLGTLGGYSNSSAAGINNSGQVVGYASDANGASHAFLWSGGSMSDLGTLGGYSNSSAAGINNSGQVVGYASDANGASHAFLWSGGSMIDVNTLTPAGFGWTLHSAVDINDLGQIVANGSLNGTSRGFVLTPVLPELEWVGGVFAEGEWSQASNWNPTQLPTAQRKVAFKQGHSLGYTVTLPADAQAKSVTIDDHPLTWSGGHLHINNPATSLTIGQSSDPISPVSLTLGNSTLVTDGSITIGTTDRRAKMTVGANSQLEVAPNAGGAITVNGGPNIGMESSLTFESGGTGKAATVNIGQNSTLTLSDNPTETYNLFVGDPPAGSSQRLLITSQLNVTAGGKIHSSSARIDAQPAAGVVSLSGSTWNIVDGATTPSTLDIGLAHKGELHLSAGSVLAAPKSLIAARDAGSNAIISVNNSTIDTTFMHFADRGVGALTISNGGRVTAVSELFLGDGAGGNATVVVTGANSKLDCEGGANGTLVIGGDGTANVTVENGAALKGPVVIGARDPAGASRGRGTLTVSGAGTILEAPLLVVGSHGEGDVFVQGGAVAQSTLVQIGKETGSRGQLSLSGAGTTLTAIEIETAALGIEVGKVGNGKLLVSSGALIEAHILAVGPHGTVQLTAGEITTNGASVEAGGSILGTGTLRLLMAPLINEGVVAPGLSPGTLTIEGDLEMAPTGQLVMEIGGYDPGQSDHLIITGDATLEGQTMFRFLNRFAPQEDDTFDFVQVQGVSSGAFADLQFDNLEPGFEFEVMNNNGVYTFKANNDAVPSPEQLTWKGTTDGSGAWDIATTANFAQETPLVYLNGDTVIFDDTANGAGDATVTVATGGAAPAQVIFDNATRNYTLQGDAITGTTGMTKSGAGVVTMNTAHTYTGPTAINGGTLQTSLLANGATASGIGQSSNAASSLVLDGGTLKYSGGNTTTDRLFTLGTAGGTIDASGVGTLVFSNSGAIVMSGSGDRTLTLRGNNTGFNNFFLQIPDPAAGKTSLTKTDSVTWRLFGSAKTYSGDTNVMNGSLYLVATNILPFGAGKGNVTVASGATLNMFGNSQRFNGLFGAGTITTTQNTTRTLTVGDANADGTFSGTLTQGSGQTLNLSKIGSGTQLLSGVNNYNGTTSASGGKLLLAATQTRSTSFTATNATIELAQGSGIVIKTQTAAASGIGRIDLQDNKMVLTGQSVGSWDGATYSGVMGMVKSGRNDGLWNGSGLVTSMTAAIAPNALTTLAVAAAADVGITTFGGVSVASTDVLVMYTCAGDANLSGNIDADDYFQIDSNYNKGEDVPANNAFKSFFRGDFNYDGRIDGDDYASIDAGYSGLSSGYANGHLNGVGSVPQSTVTPLAGASSVPEPGYGVVITLVWGMSALRRKRRK